MSLSDFPCSSAGACFDVEQWSLLQGAGDCIIAFGVICHLSVGITSVHFLQARCKELAEIISEKWHILDGKNQLQIKMQIFQKIKFGYTTFGHSQSVLMKFYYTNKAGFSSHTLHYRSVRTCP